MGPKGHPCVRRVARGVLWRGCHVPPVCARRRWGGCRISAEVVGGGDRIPGLPSESLQDARAGGGLVEDEEKGEETGKGSDGCEGDKQRSEKAAKAAAGWGHGESARVTT